MDCLLSISVHDYLKAIAGFLRKADFYSVRQGGSMQRSYRFGVWIAPLVALLFCMSAQAATYILNGVDRPALCNGNMGSWSGNTYVCGWGQPFRVEGGDEVLTTLPQMKILSYSGFNLVNSTVGGAGRLIDLEAQGSSVTRLSGSTLYGSIVGQSNNVDLLTGTTVNGSVSVTGTFKSDASTVAGNVSANNGITAVNTVFQGNLTATSGGVNLVGGEVTNNVLVTSTTIVADGTVFKGSLTNTAGPINLKNGSVAGLVKTNCCTITTSGTDLSAGAQANSGITIEGGVIAGRLVIASQNGTLVNNNIVIKDAVMVSGDINAFNIQISNSQIGSPQESIQVIARGNYLNLTDNTVVYGHVEVANTYGKINIEPGSRVVGTCLADTTRNPNVNNNVNGECGGAGNDTVHHYEFNYAAQALTCSSLSVTIRACVDAACSSTVSAPSTLTLSPSSGWASSPITFTGTTTTTLVVRSPGEVTLGISSASPAASNGLVCSTSGCKARFHDSGFLVSIPNMISSRPQSATIAAVRKDDTSQACVPAFANVTRTLSFTTSYQNPSTGTRSITVNGSSSAAPLSFNSNGVASVTVNYDDAGQVALNVSYSGSGGNSDQGLSMLGSGSFIAKPYGLCITPDTNTCSVAGVSSNCTVLASAGDPVPIRVKAVGWQGTTVNGVQTGEVLDGEALCRGNVVTPNFQLSNIGLSLSLVEPSEGVVGSNTLPSSYTHVLGEQTTLNGDDGVSFSEVGVFRITAKTSTEYMGMGHVGGDGTMSGSNANDQNRSRLIGRIVPAYLDVTPNTPLLQPNCVTDSETQTGFSYQGAAISFAIAPMLSITGKNRANGTTTNYDRGDFWRWQSSNFTHTPEFGSNDDNLHDDARLSGNPNFTVDTNDLQLGDGTRDVTIREQALTYVRNLYAPLASDAAFRPYLALRFPLTDQDGVCYKSADTSAAAVCEPYVLDNLSFPEANSQIRLGRAVLENANGSELAPLGLPLVIESWQGSYFAKTSDDSCTVFPGESEPELSNYTDNLNAGETTASMKGVGANRFVELTAPGLGNEGSVRVTPMVPELLRYDWDGSGSFQNPSGLATFGIYKGAKPLIFRREIYR